MKGLKGRKTDQEGAEWIADLTSFMPLPTFRALRDLTRERRNVIPARTILRNQILKLLEGMDIKLASFISNVFGVSGMGLVQALSRGEDVRAQVQPLVKASLRRKLTDLGFALEQSLPEHPRVLLGIHLARHDDLDCVVAHIEAMIEAQMKPYQAERVLILQVTDIGVAAANIILAEIGVDMNVFPTPAHLAARAFSVRQRTQQPSPPTRCSLLTTRPPSGGRGGPVSRILSCDAIPLGFPSLETSSNLPADSIGPILASFEVRRPIWSCSVRGLPCPSCCQSGGGLLPHPFTLA